jgi:hypothetical protein
MAFAMIQGSVTKHVAKFTYDFGTQAGAAGNITMVGDPLPDNAIIWDGVMDVILAPTGAGGTTLAVSIQAANDLVTAAAVAGAPWSTADTMIALVPVGVVAHAIKLTAARSPYVTIGTHDLTAGRIIVIIEYYLSE